MISFRSVVAVTIAALAVLVPAAMHAQSGTSTIAGIVQDSSGSTIPGAQIKVVNEDTAVALETVTNDQGVYRVGALVPWKYRVEIELSGFEPVVRRPITLEVHQQQRDHCDRLKAEFRVTSGTPGRPPQPLTGSSWRGRMGVG